MNKEYKIYGITKNTATNDYMIALDIFYSKRRDRFGVCKNCNRYNTSEAWCQTCDLQKTIQGWTSGNEKIDGCIKKFQLSAIKYEDVIEWVPFNRLNNIQIINRDVMSSEFLATWLDGIRIILNVSGEYIGSRARSYKVDLKILTCSQNLLDFLREVC